MALVGSGAPPSRFGVLTTATAVVTAAAAALISVLVVADPEPESRWVLVSIFSSLGSTAVAVTALSIAHSRRNRYLAEVRRMMIVADTTLAEIDRPEINAFALLDVAGAASSQKASMVHDEDDPRWPMLSAATAVHSMVVYAEHLRDGLIAAGDTVEAELLESKLARLRRFVATWAGERELRLRGERRNG